MSQEMSVHSFDEGLEKLKRLEAKRIIEALLFSSSEPLSLPKIREILQSHAPFSPTQVKELIEELGADYQIAGCAFHVNEIANGYQLRTTEAYRPYVEKLHGTKRPEKLSQAAAEVLAIIAYRQPIARAQIESIRGVDCSNTLHTLLERELIEQVGRADAPGRPPLYGTTARFLKHFGLNNLSQLPNLNKNAH